MTINLDKIHLHFFTDPKHKMPPMECDFWIDRAGTGLEVVSSKVFLHDDSTWYWLSVSRKDRMPTWTELTFVKNVFFSPDTVCGIHTIYNENSHSEPKRFSHNLWVPCDKNFELPDINNINFQESICQNI